MDAVALHKTHRPGIIVGPYGLAAIVRLDRVETAPISSSASSHEMRAKAPEPFGPVLRIG